jgi:DNA-binding winged helix-turn-helix (wHTH) protein
MKVFGEFEFDEKAMQLRRGRSKVAIHGQCLELLVLMLDRAGQLVTREEIRSVLWPDSTVDFEHGLDVLVNRLRMTLGENSKSARYIQTVPKKGYRFVEQVRFQRSGAPAFTSVSRTRRIAGYALVAVLAALLALLIARSRYEKFVPPHGASGSTSTRRGAHTNQPEQDP